MDIIIKTTANIPDSEATLILDQLAHAIEDESVAKVNRIQGEVSPGVKADLLTAIEVFNVVLATVGTLLTIANFVISQRPKCKLTLVKGDLSIEVDKVPVARLGDTLSELERQTSSEKVQLWIDKDVSSNDE